MPRQPPNHGPHWPNASWNDWMSGPNILPTGLLEVCGYQGTEQLLGFNKKNGEVPGNSVMKFSGDKSGFGFQKLKHVEPTSCHLPLDTLVVIYYHMIYRSCSIVLTKEIYLYTHRNTLHFLPPTLKNSHDLNTPYGFIVGLLLTILQLLRFRLGAQFPSSLPISLACSTGHAQHGGPTAIRRNIVVHTTHPEAKTEDQLLGAFLHRKCYLRHNFGLVNKCANSPQLFEKDNGFIEQLKVALSHKCSFNKFSLLFQFSSFYRLD